MKKIILTILFSGIYALGFAQGVAINTDNSVPDPSAMLDVKSTTSGLLIPRLTTAQMQAIPSPAAGLLIYNSETASYWYYRATGWTNLSTGLSWSLTGNNGTNPSVNFIGTTDDNDIVFKRNNVKAGLLNNSLNLTAFGVNALP